MKIVVDTPVWSLALRHRKRADRDATVSELMSLLLDGRVVIIGPIRQELLSGIRERAQFERLREYLQAFPDTRLESGDYEEAAALYNRCRSHGIQGSNTDFLICAVARRNQYSIFTTDDDFRHFARIIPVHLHDPARQP